MITKEELKSTLPAHLRSAATDELAQKINSVSADPMLAKSITDNFVDFVGVLREGKFKLDDYLNAVTYVTHKLMGKTNQDAYEATFPDRHREMTANGYDRKTISSYVAAYNKGKLVNLIMEQSLVPIWVMHHKKLHDALEVQADLMQNAQSEFVRSNAADSIIRALQKPKEAANVNLNIGINTENSAIDALSDAINKLTDKQSEMIRNGMSAKEIAAGEIIEGDYEERT